MTTKSVTERLAAAASGSWLISVCRRLMLSMQAPPDALPDRVIEDDLRALRSLLVGGALATRLVYRFGGAIGANPRSLAVRFAAHRRQDIEGLEPWQLIRAVGIATLTSVAIVGLSALVDPRPSSLYRWWLWIVAAAVSTVVALAARAFGAARGSSRVLTRL
jgi:hypothetical protein